VKDRNTEICAGGSAAENDAAEAVQSDSKIHGANNECGQNFGPDNWEIGSAIKHILSEKYEVRRRADHIHDVRQPHWHAFQRRRAAGKQHHYQQYRD
jgi:hypothetical protein